MLSPDVSEGVVLPSEWAPASLSELVGWRFKWLRLETTFDVDDEEVVTNLISFSHVDGKGSVTRQLNAADFQVLQYGAALEHALSCVERGVPALSLVDIT